MADAAHGAYAYCVVPAAEVPPLDGLRGVDDAGPVAVIADEHLAALTSDVPLSEFGADALRRNLEELPWLERVARAHQTVLEHALEHAEAIVPMRLCTIFEEPRHVREMLARERAGLLASLARVRHHQEWSVKLLADPRAVDDAVRARASAAAPAPAGGGAGHAYLARKRVERSAREQGNELLATAAETVHRRLGALAAAATLLPPQRPELSGRAGEMVLNGAYLVHRSRVPAFQTAVDELREQHGALGMTVELGGPWAPYNFVDGERAA